MQGKGRGGEGEEGKGEAEQKHSSLGQADGIRACSDLAEVPRLSWDVSGEAAGWMDGLGRALLPPSAGTAWLLEIPAVCSARGARLPFHQRHNDCSYITQQPIQQPHSSGEKEN